MTTIVADLKNVTGERHVGNIVFQSGAPLRMGASPRAIVTEYLEVVKPDNLGVVTVDLIPGPAIVRLGGSEYKFVVPEEPGEVNLWPLIEDYVDYDPPVVGAAQQAAARAEAAAVRAEEAAAGGGGGGQSLVPDPNDPDTFIVAAGGGLGPDPSDPDTFQLS